MVVGDGDIGRYFIVDKGLVCRNCDGVGHTQKFCPNAAKVYTVKPWSLCVSQEDVSYD